jgi:hypothetical protein
MSKHQHEQNQETVSRGQQIGFVVLHESYAELMPEGWTPGLGDICLPMFKGSHSTLSRHEWIKQQTAYIGSLREQLCSIETERELVADRLREAEEWLRNYEEKAA